MSDARAPRPGEAAGSRVGGLTSGGSCAGKENAARAPSHPEGTRPASELCRLNREQLALACRQKRRAHLLEASVPYAPRAPPSAEEAVAARARRVARAARWSTNVRAAEEVDGAIRTRTTLAHVIARGY